MRLIPTNLNDCFLIRVPALEDQRGRFLKTFHARNFDKLGLPINWREDFLSVSNRGVIRGMHFQTPPYDHQKLVYCIRGKVLDVVLDLRRKSRTYGQYFSAELDSSYGDGVIIPKGMAHGFLALTEEAIVTYKVTAEYAPENDEGIRWNSFGFNWGIDNPIVSARDSEHQKFKEFISPF